jgi:hypothetical protein
MGIGSPGTIQEVSHILEVSHIPEVSNRSPRSAASVHVSSEISNCQEQNAEISATDGQQRIALLSLYPDLANASAYVLSKKHLKSCILNGPETRSFFGYSHVVLLLPWRMLASCSNVDRQFFVFYIVDPLPILVRTPEEKGPIGRRIRYPQTVCAHRVPLPECCLFVTSTTLLTSTVRLSGVLLTW